MIGRITRWMMRRSALLACLLGVAVLGGAWLAIGAAGKDETRGLTGTKVDEHGQAKLPPLPTKLRARVVEPEAGSTGAAAPEVEDDPDLDDAGPKPTGPAGTGGRRASGVPAGVDGSSTTKATSVSNGVAPPP